MIFQALTYSFLVYMLCVNTDQLQQRHVSIHRAVIVELRALPPDFLVVCMDQTHAFALVCYDITSEILFRCLVETVVKLPSKQKNAQNAEEQTGRKDDQQPGKHDWDGPDQNLNYQLHKDR